LILLTPANHRGICQQRAKGLSLQIDFNTGTICHMPQPLQWVKVAPHSP